ncbi:MAG: T9SS C-terminal target domain-containing protein [Sphingobacteriales bacterium]|nr:MAG: T9SS C-terminal target domain-containing protein [Sphingobacteriales bacterium]
MKKTFKLFALLFLACATNTFATDYYVATNGNNDTNTGLTLASPFLTISKAASLVQPGDNVFVRGGTYRETVRPAVSGTLGNPITFQPYNAEKVIISGTELITDWTVHSGNIYKATMAGNFMPNVRNQSDQIFVNGDMMTLAQWPNRTQSYTTEIEKSKAVFNEFISKTTTGNTTTGVMIDNELPTGDFIGAEIYVQPNYEAWSWVFTGKVTNVVGKTLTFQSFSGAGQDGNQDIYNDRSRYFIFNKLSLLDNTEEWFHDLTAGILYLQAPSNQNPSSLTVEAKKREYAFNLSTRSFITIKGFNLFACSITTDIDAGGNNRGYTSTGLSTTPWRIKDFLATSKNCIIDGIKAKYLSHYTDVSGHMFLQWGGSSGIVLSGSDHLITNSVLQFSAGNGITLNGERNKAINNTITDMDYMANDCAAINTVGSQAISRDHEIAYNTISRMGRSGIAARNFVNSSPTNLIARIHHNEVGFCALQDWDCGGIYGIAESGNNNFARIDHNIVHDVEGFINCGIYFDFTRNIIVDHNIVYNVDGAFKNQGASLQPGFLTNNALTYNNTGVVRTLQPKGYGPFGFAGGSTTNIGTLAQNNILLYRNGNNATAPQGYKDFSEGYGDATLITNFVHSQGDPKFVDLVGRNFQLQATSPCINAGTPVGVITRDGIAVPPFNDPTTGTVDIGAFEFGQPAWTAGSTIIDTPTPVDLISLEGNATNAGNLLKWTTLGERNNKQFNVLKSSDGQNFEKIATVKSLGVNGNSTSVLNYNYTDKDVLETAYYKLEQIDFDGTIKPSKVVVVKSLFANDFTNTVYPNPVSDVLNAEITSNTNNNLTFTLINTSGVVVYKKSENIVKGKSTIAVNMANKASGLYILNVKESSGKTILSKKVIKK